MQDFRNIQCAQEYWVWRVFPWDCGVMQLWLEITFFLKFLQRKEVHQCWTGTFRRDQGMVSFDFLSAKCRLLDGNVSVWALNSSENFIGKGKNTLRKGVVPQFELNTCPRTWSRHDCLLSCWVIPDFYPFSLWRGLVAEQICRTACSFVRYTVTFIFIALLTLYYLNIPECPLICFSFFNSCRKVTFV